MSVYDKELIIDGKAVRSPEQQVYKNMKDIKDLQEIIKPEYTTSATLTSSSVSVAIADTNAPEGTTEGWLLTQDGLKFKITGGDETNLLLEFYCSIQGPEGPEGPSGADLEIDDSGTSATKVWSSQKVAQEVANAGEQLYHHTIQYYRYSASVYTRVIINTTNGNPNKINTIALLKQWLTDNEYTASTPRLCVGDSYDGSNWRAMREIWIDNNNQIAYRYFNGSTNQSGTDVNDSGSVQDCVEEC